MNAMANDIRIGLNATRISDIHELKQSIFKLFENELLDANKLNTSEGQHNLSKAFFIIYYINKLNYIYI